MDIKWSVPNNKTVITGCCFRCCFTGNVTEQFSNNNIPYV